MHTRLTSDEALVRQLLPSGNGDVEARDQAWETWWCSKYGSQVMRYIRHHTRTEQEAMDVYLDTRIKAYLSLEAGEYEYWPGKPLTAYVLTIAKNVIRTQRRKTSREVEFDEDMVESQLFHRTDEPWREPEMEVERREEEEVLHSSVNRLPAKTRLVLTGLMRGLSTSELADELGMTEAAVRQHKHRGVETLRETGLFQESWAA
jgi:RNA polymerase sigma factor (sigma-70 family)